MIALTMLVLRAIFYPQQIARGRKERACVALVMRRRDGIAACGMQALPMHNLCARCALVHESRAHSRRSTA